MMINGNMHDDTNKIMNVMRGVYGGGEGLAFGGNVVVVLYPL